jgi:N-glycosylase/DNA lyase
VRVRATAKGNRVLQRGREARVRRIDVVLEQMSTGDRDDVERALSLLANALTQAIEAERG